MKNPSSRRPVILAIMAVLLCVVLVGLVFAEKTCPSCGTENGDNAKFCKKCGAKLPASAPARPATPRVDVNVKVENGIAAITSEPSGADVYVDGELRGKTPLNLTGLSVTRHELRVASAGYRDYVGGFTISGRYGVVVVTSDPVGAEILLDGVIQGRTTESGLPLGQVLFGEHRLAARATGYRDVEKTITVKSAAPIAVNFRLGWGKGFLRVQSEPAGARVTSQGSILGESPLSREMDPARYLLTLSKRGYYDWTGYGDVQFAETTLVVAELERVATRKLPLLLAGVAGFAAAGFSAYKGEAEYALYRSASNREESEKYKSSTQKWDMIRNVSAGIGGALTITFFTLRW